MHEKILKVIRAKNPQTLGFWTLTGGKKMNENKKPEKKKKKKKKISLGFAIKMAVN